MEGVCSECGLGFGWRYVLNPRMRIPAWSFEHSPDDLAWCGLVTMVRSRWATRLWQLLPVETPIVERRLGPFRLGSVAAAWIGSGLVSLGLLFLQYLYGVGQFGMWRTSFLPALMDTRAGWAVVLPFGALEHWDQQLLTPFTVIGLAWTLVFPTTLVLLPQTRKRCRVRPEQFARIRAYADWRVIVACSVPTWMRLIEVDSWWFGYPSGEAVISLVGAGLPIGLVAWFWWRSLARYLKLPHAGGIMLINGTLALLVSVLCAMLIAAAAGITGFFEPLPHL